MKITIDFRLGAWYIVNPTRDGEALKKPVFFDCEVPQCPWNMGIFIV